MVTKERVSLDDFLAMPETEPPSELIDGEVIQKVAPSIHHGVLTSLLIGRLLRYCEESGEAFVANEVRHVQRNEERVFLPDISVYRNSQRGAVMAAGSERPVDLPPAFAIEVLSPGTSYARTAERVAFYMRTGTEVLWVVDPQERVVAIHRPGNAVSLQRAPQIIDARPVLGDFRLDLTELFAVLG